VRAKVGEAGPPYTPYVQLSPPPTPTPTLYSAQFLPPSDVTAGVAFVLYVYEGGPVCFDDIAIRVAPP